MSSERILPQVLLVDDDQMDIMTVRRAFRKARIEHPVAVVGNGVQALSALRGMAPPELPDVQRPVLILLDLKMPQMDGIEFLDELRSDPELSDHVVFVMTTSESPQDRNAAYSRHAAAFLLKSDIGKCPEVFTDMVSSYLKAVQLPS